MSTHALNLKLSSRSGERANVELQRLFDRRRNAEVFGTEKTRIQNINRNEPRLAGTSTEKVQGTESRRSLYTQLSLSISNQKKSTSVLFSKQDRALKDKSNHHRSFVEDFNKTTVKPQLTSVHSLTLPQERNKKNKSSDSDVTPLSRDCLQKCSAPRIARSTLAEEHTETCEEALPSNTFDESKDPSPEEAEQSKPKAQHGTTDEVLGSTVLNNHQQTTDNYPQGQQSCTGTDDETQVSVNGHVILNKVRDFGLTKPLEQCSDGAVTDNDLISLSLNKDDTEPDIGKHSSETQVLSPPFSRAVNPSKKPETESKNSTSNPVEMFTSTLATVLAPHWSGRFRRHKRAPADVSETEQETERSRQSLGLSGTVSQDSLQRPSLGSGNQAGGDVFPELGKQDRPLFGTKSLIDWQRRRNAFSLRTRRQTTPVLLARSRFNSVSVDVSRPDLDRKDDFDPSVSMSQDTAQMVRADHPLDLSRNAGMSLSLNQEETFSTSSSKPTTSSLLLSLRRLNSNPKKTDVSSTELETHPITPGRSLILPGRSTINAPQPFSPTVSHIDRTPETFTSQHFQTSSTVRSGLSPSSYSDTKLQTPRAQLFSLSKDDTELDVSSRAEGPTTATGISKMERRCPTPPRIYSRIDSLKAFTQDNNLGSSKLQNSNNPSNANRNIVSLDKSSTDLSTNIPSNSQTNVHVGVPQTAYNLNSGCKQTTLEKSDNTSITRQSKQNTLTSPENLNSSGNTTDIQNVSFNSETPSEPTRSVTHENKLSYQSSIKADDQYLSPTTEPPNKRTFTDSLSSSPKREHPTVERNNPTHVWLEYLQSKQRSLSGKSPEELKTPSSPSKAFRGIRAPSIYSYLRSGSPTVASPEAQVTKSSSPQTPGIRTHHSPIGKEQNKELREGDRTPATRFTFDLNSPSWTRDSCNSSGPKSLPPDFGNRPTPRISSSPYSTLISARSSLGSGSQGVSPPPVTHHVRCKSHNKSTECPDTVKMYRRSYPLSRTASVVLSPSVEQATSANEAIVASRANNYSCAPLDPYGLSSQFLPEPSVVRENRVSMVNTDTAQPKQNATLIGNCSQQKYGWMSAPKVTNLDNDQNLNFTTTDVSPLVNQHKTKNNPLVVSEMVHMHNYESLLETQPSNSDDRLSTLGSQRDYTSNPAAKKVITPLVEVTKHSTHSKNNSKVDQMLHQIKQTFKVKSSDKDILKNTKDLSQHSVTSSNPDRSRRQEEKCPKNKEVLKLFNFENTMERNPSTFQFEQDHMSSMTFKSTRSEEPRFPPSQDRATDENGNNCYRKDSGPYRAQSDHGSRYATLPQYRRPSTSNVFSVFSFDFDDMDNDKVFYSNRPPRRKTASMCDPEDVYYPGSTQYSGKQYHMGTHLSSSCADLRYGLEKSRSISVSSIVSSRPSGPGRISMGSKTSSMSDSPSFDEIIISSTHTSMDDTCSSPMYSPNATTNPGVYTRHTGRLPVVGYRRSPSQMEKSTLPLDKEADPTPPPSPTFSPTSQRISRARSSSTGSWTSQESLSPRCLLPSKNYKSSLCVFEESSSETTTDDEYYLDSDDGEKETQL